MERTQGEKRKEKGQSLIEMALLVPVLLIILAGILDLGRLFFAYVAVTDAAAEGATYAAINPPASCITCPTAPVCPTDNPNNANCTCARAISASGGLIQVVGSNVAINCPSGTGSGQPIAVTVRYDFRLATPLLNVIVPGGVLPLRAVVTETILGGRLP